MPAAGRAPRPGSAGLRADVAAPDRAEPSRTGPSRSAPTCCAAGRGRPALRPCPWCCRGARPGTPGAGTAEPSRPRRARPTGTAQPRASCCAGPAGRSIAFRTSRCRSRLGTMAALPRLLCASSVLLVLWAGFCSAVCVEVPSETEAVQGTHMKLLCISCMKREEVTASTVVEWFYRPEGGKDEPIYEYRKTNHEFPSRFSGRLQWNGSKDMQDVSITVLNVTLNDSGIYTCNITREFEFEIHRPLFTSSRLIHLTVVEEAGEDFTSVISEIMMYILLVFLTLWLLIEMVYCYRKVSKAEEAAQENATDYLAIPSENKENCAVPVEE
ncbi:LOW QUALITY PROTEIN: sodium channel regulatory subunit beta-3 [Aegotheles albertisi]